MHMMMRVTDAIFVRCAAACRMELEMDAKRTYIITGVEGFLGNNLVRLLHANSDAQVRGVVFSSGIPASLQGFDLRIFRGDVTKPETLRAIFDFSGQDEDMPVYIIHCAGVIDIDSKPNPMLHAVNVNGTRNMLIAAQQLSAKHKGLVRYLQISSVHAIPEAPEHELMHEVDHYDPALVVGQYAKSKAEASQLVLDAARSGLDAQILQPSGILGPNNYSPENMMQLMTEVASGKLRAVIPGGYDFVDVRDVAQGILAACDKGRSGQSYILSNRYIQIKEICDEVCALSGRKLIRMVLPVWVAKLGAPFCELYYRLRHQVPLFTSYAIHTAEANANFSHEKATRELGYTTRPIEETVRDMLGWIVSHPDKAPS